MAYASIGKGLFSVARFGVRGITSLLGAGLKAGGKATGTATKGLYKHRGAIWQSGVAIPARGIYGVGKFAVKNVGRIAGPAFIGYEISKGKDLPEGLIRGGAEATRLGAAIAGSVVGQTAIPIPLVGALIGGFAGYMGMDEVLKKGFGRSRSSYEEVYQNRRVLTMRQASMMTLARSKRNAFGREASTMHLR